MALKTGLKYGDKQQYDALIDALDGACTRANCGSLKATPLAGRFKGIEDGVSVLEGFIHLRSWPGKTYRLNILVQFQETINVLDKSLTKSTVRVDHYSIKSNKDASLLQGVHFDFDGEKDQHPIFHAQFRDRPIKIDQKSAQEVSFDYKVRASTACCYGHARIPTSDMTLPSVLLCLAADHLPKREVFCEFRDHTVKIQGGLPKPLAVSLATSLKADSSHVRSSHWFAHMKSASH